MKAKSYIILFAIVLFVFLSSSYSFALTDWKLDIDGNGPQPAETISDYINTLGVSYIDNDINAGDDGAINPGDSLTFRNWGFFRGDSYDLTSNDFSWNSDGYQLTGTIDLTGNGVLGGDINFTGGTLEIYADDTRNYGTDTDGTPNFSYGADDGTNIATFNLSSGIGAIGDNAEVNGDITLNFQSSDLAAGYWFDQDGNDLSETDPINWILGLSTTNANTIDDGSVDDITRNEMAEFSGVSNPETNTPQQLFVSNNGQYRISQVPEPTTMLLFGTGLLGLGIFGRRKFMKNKS